MTRQTCSGTTCYVLFTPFLADRQRGPGTSATVSLPRQLLIAAEQTLFGQRKVRLPVNGGLQKGGDAPLLSPLIRARDGRILPFGYTIITLLCECWGFTVRRGGTDSDNYIRRVCVCLCCLVATFPLATAERVGPALLI